MAIIYVSLHWVSCVKTERDAQDETVQAQEQEQGAVNEKEVQPSQPKRSLTIELDREREKEKEEEQETTENARMGTVPVSFKERLLTLKNGEDILPEDMIIGKLQSKWPGAREERAVYQTIKQFFSSLNSGTIDKEVVHPERIQYIERLFWYYLQQEAKIQQVRIGTVSAGEASAESNIRVFSGEGRADGEIFLERLSGSWYVTDVEIDFPELREQYTREEKFEPAVYRWLETR